MVIFKKIVALITTFVMVVGLAACGGNKVTISVENTNSSDTPKETKKYIIATNTMFAPFEFQNKFGEYVGIDIDLLNEIAKDQGFEYELVHMTFNQMLQALAAGEVDAAMGGISITEERKEIYDYSEPYLEGGIVMAVDATRHDIKGFEDLKGKTVAVAVALGTEAESYAQSIKEKYGFQVVTFPEFNQVYQDVISGNSQALFEDYPVMGYLISQGVELKIVSDIEKRSPYGFAVPKGKNAELLEKFNNGLKNIMENGTYDKIINTYVQS
ncbi:transporter substrate-binding domain-containing protein [Anaerotignum propionicum]|jgi:polar amino acid transport system substrate-binding protein|uniref:Amino acid ABC transporter substrate-binding protein, PAAT family (TC 3.A.1.3.-) n=2 Tax=Anaerotignum propionicum DSM 1682 TaxID=991789 RepID=A0AA94HXC7_ANAPI|nr:transporter substrate-binding domain-containing protein [Anaerotignum propionicum]MEA5056993.1 transporter substrate-binding domain-containing protein [Anaerotignum propionicum]SHE51077.1 amino acid ABC transporter substrate-binding protein, PAAT family (TC 3.A.1.3.-) [[Clostridium] propionicum DSM 1682] [Anaerotignum propionicum DSM 1682]